MYRLRVCPREVWTKDEEWKGLHHHVLCDTKKLRTYLQIIPEATPVNNKIAIFQVVVRALDCKLRVAMQSSTTVVKSYKESDVSR